MLFSGVHRGVSTLLRPKRAWTGVDCLSSRWSRETLGAMKHDRTPQAAAGVSTWLSSSMTEMLTGHNYDGIQEYDNPTPALVVVADSSSRSIVSSVVYVLWFHVSLWGMSPDRGARGLVIKRDAELEKKFGAIDARSNPTTDDQDPRRIMDNEEYMARSARRSVFALNCAQCHGAGRQGQQRPEPDRRLLHQRDAGHA